MPFQLSIYTNECFEFEPAVFTVVRRARRDLATQKATRDVESISWNGTSY